MFSIKQLSILLVIIAIPNTTFSQYNQNTYSIDSDGEQLKGTKEIMSAQNTLLN